MQNFRRSFGYCVFPDLLSSKVIATLSTIERLRQTLEWTPVEEPPCHRNGVHYGLLTGASGAMLLSFASIPHRYTASSVLWVHFGLQANLFPGFAHLPGQLSTAGTVGLSIGLLGSRPPNDGKPQFTPRLMIHHPSTDSYSLVFVKSMLDSGNYRLQFSPGVTGLRHNTPHHAHGTFHARKRPCANDDASLVSMTSKVPPRYKAL